MEYCRFIFLARKCAFLNLWHSTAISLVPFGTPPKILFLSCKVEKIIFYTHSQELHSHWRWLVCAAKYTWNPISQFKESQDNCKSDGSFKSSWGKLSHKFHQLLLACLLKLFWKTKDTKVKSVSKTFKSGYMAGQDVMWSWDHSFISHDLIFQSSYFGLHLLNSYSDGLYQPSKLLNWITDHLIVSRNLL